MADRSFVLGSFVLGGCSTNERRPHMLAVDVLGWVGSALLVYSVLQTRILRLRLFNGVASALLVIFNAAIAVWPMGRAERDAHRDQRFLYCAAATWQARLADVRGGRDLCE